MGEHVDNRKSVKRHKKTYEGDAGKRQQRVSFKNYLRQVEEELLEDDLNSLEENGEQAS
jgi:hypothetical protein